MRIQKILNSLKMDPTYCGVLIDVIKTILKKKVLKFLFINTPKEKRNYFGVIIYFQSKMDAKGK